MSKETRKYIIIEDESGRVRNTYTESEIGWAMLTIWILGVLFGLLL